MIFEEFNLDVAKKVWFEEGMEEGIEKGIQKGKQEIIELLKSGKSPEEILTEYDGK